VLFCETPEAFAIKLPRYSRLAFIGDGPEESPACYSSLSSMLGVWAGEEECGSGPHPNA